MKVGIIGAMTEEIDLLRSSLELERETIIANRVYHEGTLEGHPATVVFSRWGKVAAASTATTLIDRFGAELIVFTGVAGAIDPDIEIGDIVIASRLVQHDFDASASGLFPPHEIPLLGITHFSVDGEYVTLAERAALEYLDDVAENLALNEARREMCPKGAHVRLGIIASGDQFISDPAKILHIRKTFPGTSCVEMEGAAVAQVAYEHGVPCVVVRSISDRADHTASVDFLRFIKEVASHYSHGIVTRLLKAL